MPFITLDLNDRQFRETLTWLAAKPEQVERAERRAVSKTLKWAGRFVATTLSHQNRVPLKALTKGGASGSGKRIRFHLPRGFENEGSVWIGTQPVKASYVGKVRQLKKGARSGAHFFERAFVASMKSGHAGIFKRLGKSRLPIREQSIKLNQAGNAVKAAQRFIPTRLTKLLAQEINYEVNVRG